MIQYVNAYRDQVGVERICRVPGVTAGGFLNSRGCRVAKPRRCHIVRFVTKSSVRNCNASMAGTMGDVWGAEMHHLMRREGYLVGRDQVARVMRTRGISEVRRGKGTFTTRSETTDANPIDNVKRKFVA